MADPVSRAYYDKKIAQGKHHTQDLLCLARRRADVLFAMLRDGTIYEDPPSSNVLVSGAGVRVVDRARADGGRQSAALIV